MTLPGILRSSTKKVRNPLLPLSHVRVLGTTPISWSEVESQNWQSGHLFPLDHSSFSIHVISIRPVAWSYSPEFSQNLCLLSSWAFLNRSTKISRILESRAWEEPENCSIQLFLQSHSQFTMRVPAPFPLEFPLFFLFSLLRIEPRAFAVHCNSSVFSLSPPPHHQAGIKVILLLP